MSKNASALRTHTTPSTTQNFSQPFARKPRNEVPKEHPRGTAPEGSLNDVSAALTAALVKPVTPEQALLADPSTLWTRANLMNHIRLAADVRVKVRLAGPPYLVKIQKTDLLNQLKDAAPDAKFPAPELRYESVGVVLVLN